MHCRKPLLWASLCLIAAIPASAQQKKSAPPASALADAANLCAHPYGEHDYAKGWPEAPVYILYHRKDSPAPWSHNPAIVAPGFEASSPATARTLVCVEETLEEKGKYRSGAIAYLPHWDHITIVSLADRATYRGISEPSFSGEEPPFVKYQTGPGVGKPPVQPFLRWLRLLADQKVAHFRMRLDWPSEVSGSLDYAGLYALVISSDGTKVAAARQSRRGYFSPLVVFDLASGKPLATLRIEDPPQLIAISKTGKWIATAGEFTHGIDIWETSSGNRVHKLDTPKVSSMLFGPDDALAVSAGGKVTVWEVEPQRPIRSVDGSRAMVSTTGAWLLAARSADTLTITEMESGHSIATFPGSTRGTQYILSQDGTSLADLSNGDAELFLSDSATAHELTLPSIYMNSPSIKATAAIAATPDGVAFAGQGFVGLASTANPKPRFFANGNSYIRNIAVSADGKLLVLGTIESDLYVWELR
jgi:hypothetical protein